MSKNTSSFFPPKRVKTRRFLETVKQEQQEQQEQQQKKSFLRPLHYITRGQKSIKIESSINAI